MLLKKHSRAKAIESAQYGVIKGKQKQNWKH